MQFAFLYASQKFANSLTIIVYDKYMSTIKKIARKVIPKESIENAEESYRLNKAKAANMLRRHPAKGMHVVGVTGTNGKTTTCAFINEVLKAGGKKTAVYTTAFTEINGKRSANKTHMTVASAWSVQKFFAKAKKADVDWVVLEITSHALDQYRIYGVPIEIAVVTNLTQEHLDYHKTMENYAAAKARLITDFNPKTTILNAEDEWFEYFGRKVKNKLVTVGTGNATDQIKELRLAADGTHYNLVSSKFSIPLAVSLVGKFNAFNSAMAAAVGQAVGLSTEQIQNGIKNVQVVPGRLEAVDAGQDFSVLVDYAHTPDAIENVLVAAQEIAKGRVAIVFGATGVGEYARDTTKRAPMGEVAAKHADYIYLTDDETYLEDPAKIRKEVEAGIVAAGGEGKYIEIGDRRDAITQAFKDAKTGDVIILAGIGHQDYRAMGGKKEPWDERIISREILISLNLGKK